MFDATQEGPFDRFVVRATLDAPSKLLLRCEKLASLYGA